MGTRGREGVIKGAFGRQSGVDMRMQGERLRTVLSSKWRVDIVDEAAAGARAAAGSAAAERPAAGSVGSTAAARAVGRVAAAAAAAAEL